MRHTYLLEPGTWRAEGSYVNAAGESLAITGASRIRHGESWRVEGQLELSGDPEVHIRNDYLVQPFPADASTTTWSSDNPALGRLSGAFTLVGDAIVSVYRSDDGAHQGTECLRRIDDDRYEGYGALFRGVERVSSWSVTLIRVR